MRKIILALLFIAPICSFAQQQFLIKGRIKNIQAPAKVYLSYRYKGAPHSKWDSTIVKNGEFEFRGSVADTVLATIWVDYKGINLDDIWRKDNVDTKDIYLANDTTIITSDDSIRSAKFSGNKLNEDFYKYRLMITAAQSDSEQTATNQRFIKENPNSYISFHEALLNMARGNFNVAEVEPSFESLPASIRMSKEGLEVQQHINAAKIITNGSIAPDFELPDTGGKPVKLSSYKGKYILVDFWASWCAPCRRTNPGIVKVFNRYKNKNFTILGVSLDNPKGKDAWLKAIHSDGLEWAQVSDLKGWDSKAAKLYAVLGIPQNFLIDPQGKIIAQSLGPDELESELAKVLN